MSKHRVVHLTGVVTFVTSEELQAAADRVLSRNSKATVEDVATEIGYAPGYRPDKATVDAVNAAHAAAKDKLYPPAPTPAPAPAPSAPAGEQDGDGKAADATGSGQ